MPLFKSRRYFAALHLAAVIFLGGCASGPVFFQEPPSWASAAWIDDGKLWLMPRNDVHSFSITVDNRVVDGARSGPYLVVERGTKIVFLHTTPTDAAQTTFVGEKFWEERIERRVARNEGQQ